MLSMGGVTANETFSDRVYSIFNVEKQIGDIVQF